MTDPVHRPATHRPALPAHAAQWPHWPFVPWAAWLLAVAAAAAFSAPLAQDPAYHLFADARPWLGLPNFGDVASNAALTLAGLAGLWAVRRRARRDPAALGVPHLPVAVLFFGAVALAGVCSAYYHWAPDEARLAVDRLPIGGIAAAFPALVLAERAPVTRAGLRALWLWLALGPLTVGYWHYTEGLGRGDLRPYLAVQAVALLGAAVLPALLPRRHTPGAAYGAAVALYLAAVACEQGDRAVFAATGLVSGHTLKHLLAAAAVAAIAWGWGRGLPVRSPA